MCLIKVKGPNVDFSSTYEESSSVRSLERETSVKELNRNANARLKCNRNISVVQNDNGCLVRSIPEETNIEINDKLPSLLLEKKTHEKQYNTRNVVFSSIVANELLDF